MKRRREAMEPDEFIAAKVTLVERNSQPMGLQLANPTAVGRPDRASLVQLAQEIETAHDFVDATAGAQLRLIAEQMSVLRRQAERVLMEAARSERLHRAACNFRKVPGRVYHLYSRPSGQEYLSMLAPQEWSSDGPPAGHDFLGSFRLEADRTWVPAGSDPPRSVPLSLAEIYGRADSVAVPAKVVQRLRAIESRWHFTDRNDGDVSD